MEDLLGECGVRVEGLVNAREAERDEGRQEKRVALGEVVVPWVAAVEDGERLRDIKVEEAEWWKGPLLIV